MAKEGEAAVRENKMGECPEVAVGPYWTQTNQTRCSEEEEW